MILSRIGAYYHCIFVDESGSRHKVSTRCTHKSDALKFLQRFRMEDRKRRSQLTRLLLSEFENTFLAHASTIHTPKAAESHRTALSQLRKVLGDVPLHKVGIREVESFLAKKKLDASVGTTRKYYLALASASETARH